MSFSPPASSIWRRSAPASYSVIERIVECYYRRRTPGKGWAQKIPYGYNTVYPARCIPLIVSIMPNPTDGSKERLDQFWKRNAAFRKTIAKRQKELDASLNARRTRFVPSSPSSGISGPLVERLSEVFFALSCSGCACICMGWLTDHFLCGSSGLAEVKVAAARNTTREIPPSLNGLIPSISNYNTMAELGSTAPIWVKHRISSAIYSNYSSHYGSYYNS